MAEVQARVPPAPLGLAVPANAIWRFLREHGLVFFITALLLWVVGAPIGFLTWFSFHRGSPINPGEFTFNNYLTVYSSPLTYPALLNTVIYAGVVTVFGLGLAALLAWLVERTDMPCRDFAWTVMLLPLAMPGLLASMAWILMLQPKTGLVNLPLRWLLAQFGIVLDTGPLNIYTLQGMIFVESIRGSTTLFLMMVGAFRLMDPALEEAALISGAGTFKTMRKVTLGLMLPAILAAGMYAFLGNLEDFETPLLIGLPAGVYILPTLIYFTAYQSPQHGLAAAYTSIFLIITVVLVVVYYRVILRNAERYASITGKGFRPRRMSLGRWRHLAFGLFLLYFGLNIALPLLVLIWASLLPVYQVPSLEILSKISLSNYARMLQEDAIVSSIMNTIYLATITATGTMALAFMVSWLVVRQKVRGGVALDAISFIPHAIPTVAIGIALVIFYLHPAIRWIGIYGTMLIMALALMTRYLAFGTRSSNAAMTQINKELEEAAYLSGAGRIRTAIKITTPLLLPTFVAGWVWVAAHAFRNLTIPLMLSTAGTQTIATILYHYWERKADFPLASALGVSLLLSMSVVIFLARKLIARGYTQD